MAAPPGPGRRGSFGLTRGAATPRADSTPRPLAKEAERIGRTAGFPVPADRRNLHGAAGSSFTPPRPLHARLPAPVGPSPAGQPGKLSQVRGVLSLIGSKFKRDLIVRPYISGVDDPDGGAYGGCP